MKRTGAAVSGPGPGVGIERVAVVLPVHNEQAALPRALAGLRAAARCAPVPVDLVVVLDSCTDSSAAHLQGLARTTVLAVAARNVGIARAAGMAAAIGSEPCGLWLMSTDADSVVPPDWVTSHLAHATRGADMVLGTVTVADWQDWPAGLSEAYQHRYASRVRITGHAHVHGANLSLSAHAYLTAGGFPPLVVAEDRALARAARAAGLRVLSVTDAPVSTSARPFARAPHGFSAHLHSLAAAEPANG